MGYSYDRTAAASNGSFDAFWNKITYKASDKIRSLDESFVGTPDYMGIAFFWSMAYKYELREASLDKRRAVHAAFLKAGLKLDEESQEHAAIVNRIAG